MARNPQDVNADDVFPRRNLSEEAEPWGRVLEDRVVALEKALLGQAGSVKGINRNIASTLPTLSEQIIALGEQQTELENQQTELAEAQAVLEETQGDIVSVVVYGSAGTTSDLASTSAVDVRSELVTIPDGFTTANVISVATLSGNIGSNTSNRAILETRINGTDYGYDQTSSPPAFQRTTGATMGTATVTTNPFYVTLRARTAVSQDITGIYSNIRVMVIFTK